LSYIAGFTVGGAVSRVDPSATSVGERAIGFEMNIVSAWPPADDSADRHIAWVRDGWEAPDPAVYTPRSFDRCLAAPKEGFEPPTRRLTAACSAD
jgi:hypothetical protein